MNKVPAVVAAFMLTLCYTACGGLALAVGGVFYFLKVLICLYVSRILV